MLPREHRLRSSREIREVVNRGKRVSNPIATLHLLPAQQSAFAIIISKAVGNAVVRNLVKRRMRAILRQYTNHQPSIRGAFRMKPKAAEIGFQDLGRAVSELMEQIR